MLYYPVVEKCLNDFSGWYPNLRMCLMVNKYVSLTLKTFMIKRVEEGLIMKNCSGIVEMYAK